MKERRKFPRKDVKLKVICSTGEWQREEIAATAVDISSDGIGLRLKKLIGKGKNLTLKIQKTFWEKPVEARGRLVWQSSSDEEGEVRAGIQFTDVPWTQLCALVN